MADGLKTQQGWVPIPDPTTLTTEQLRREINGLREEIIERIGASQKFVEAQVASNRALYEERFRGVVATFQERQHQSDQSDKATDKGLEQLRTLLDAVTKNSDKNIGDLKDRLTRIEGKGEGANWLLGVGIAIAGLVIAAAILMAKEVPTPVTPYVPQPQPQFVQPVQPVPKP